MKEVLQFYLMVILLGSCAHNPQEKFRMGNLYFQKAPEVKALYWQGYNSATDYLLKNVVGREEKQCIVFDIDETILDNSPYQGWLYKYKKNYQDQTWEYWVKLARAQALPGAIDFIKLAIKNGVQPLYVTNRREHLVEATLVNLQKLGLKVAKEDIVGRGATSSKLQRRKAMSKDCHIAMLLGDSLADFDHIFESDYDKRHQGVKTYAKKWGRSFIIFPNPMYGDWIRKAGKLQLSSFDD